MTSVRIVTCPACSKDHNLYGDGYAWLSGKSYCSKECYDTLFHPCKHCGDVTMGECGTLDKETGMNECLPCYLKTRGLVVVRIC